MSPRKLATWYHQLADLCEAGIPLPQAIEQTAGPDSDSRTEMARQLQSGLSIDEVLRHAPRWLPTNDRYYISAGAASGRLPTIFRKLAVKYDELSARMTRAMLSLLYPLAVVNLAAFLLPVASRLEFNGEGGGGFKTDGYVGDVLLVLLPLWGILTVVVLLYRRRPDVLYIVGRWLPLIGKCLQYRSLAEFCRGLGMFLDAGLRIDHAWAGATMLSNAPDLQRQARSGEHAISSGSSPLAVIRNMPAFPSEFQAFYAAGERTGHLAENMLRIADRFDSKANQWTFLAFTVYPSLLSIAVAVYVGFAVLSFYKSYFDFLESMW